MSRETATALLLRILRPESMRSVSGMVSGRCSVRAVPCTWPRRVGGDGRHPPGGVRVRPGPPTSRPAAPSGAAAQNPPSAQNQRQSSLEAGRPHRAGHVWVAAAIADSGRAERKQLS